MRAGQSGSFIGERGKVIQRTDCYSILMRRTATISRLFRRWRKAWLLPLKIFICQWIKQISQKERQRDRKIESCPIAIHIHEVFSKSLSQFGANVPFPAFLVFKIQKVQSKMSSSHVSIEEPVPEIPKCVPLSICLFVSLSLCPLSLILPLLFDQLEKEVMGQFLLTLCRQMNLHIPLTDSNAILVESPALDDKQV